MTIDLNRLKGMQKPELIDLAKQLNAPHHHMNSAETLIENIINKVMEQSLTHSDKQLDKPQEKVVAQFLTEEELEAKFAPLKEKYKAFSTVYDHESGCVTLRYSDGRYRHAETMSLSCPLTKFMRKATEIAKGPLIPRSLRADDWSHLGGSDKNRYTEAVLAG